MQLGKFAQHGRIVGKTRGRESLRRRRVRAWRMRACTLVQDVGMNQYRSISLIPVTCFDTVPSGAGGTGRRSR